MAWKGQQFAKNRFEYPYAFDENVRAVETQHSFCQDDNNEEEDEVDEEEEEKTTMRMRRTGTKRTRRRSRRTTTIIFLDLSKRFFGFVENFLWICKKHFLDLWTIFLDLWTKFLDLAMKSFGLVD